jgi:cellulose synthase/poly-beta-1,6-N-acetylglucosamine synthase-like glycosyltransferase
LTLTAVEVLFWATAALCLYPYLGYPLLLLVRAHFWPKPVARREIAPKVSIIIAAHNEAQQLGSKIENMLALDYPTDLLEIIVASDGSDDGTAQIARNFEWRGVLILDMPRRGKLHTLNQAVAASRGEILVLTDANATFAPDALQKLVQPFADPQVGGVCGNQKFHARAKQGDSAAGGEGAYWAFDKALKQLESASGSIVAADGSIYALRRELYIALDDGAQADDFAISARVVTEGRKRLLFEPHAISFEPPPADSGLEFRRKARIANHSFRAVLALHGGLNPFRTGFYAVALWSHKVLRFAFPLFAAIAFGCSIILAANWPFYRALLGGELLFILLALAGWALRKSALGGLKVISLPFYFCLANAALLLGLLSLFRGERIARWEPQRH